MIEYETTPTSVRNRAVVGDVLLFCLLKTSCGVDPDYVTPAGVFPLCAALDVTITRSH